MTRVGKYNLLLLAGALCAVPLTGCSKSDNSTDAGSVRATAANAANAATHKHNVLLVTLDTTRVDYLSCYDSSKRGPRPPRGVDAAGGADAADTRSGQSLDATGKLTPNLDAVADDAIRFDFAISASPATPMSHASILTGLWPYQHGVRVISAAAGYKLSNEIPTLTTRLKDAGWTTAAFLSSFTVSEYYGFDHGFDTFDSGLAQDADTIVEDLDGGFQKWDQKTHQRRSDRTIDATTTWLAQAGAQPFFLWVHLWDPHDRAVLPPRDVLARFVTPQMKPNSPKWKEAIYRAEVFFMDAQFGRLLRALKDSGRYDDTIIVIVADHGQGLGQHNWWSHRILYQEDLHVPLIVRLPGGPTGRVVPDLVRTVDIYPTVLEKLGLDAGDGIPGRSLQNLIAGESEPPRMAYADVINKYDLVNLKFVTQRPKADLLYSAMDRTWKLIFRYSFPEQSELYNLLDDPHELNNLFAQAPQQVKRLKAILDEHNGYVTAPFGTAAPDPAALRALRSIGYVGGDEDEEQGEEEDAGEDQAQVPDGPNQPESDIPATTQPSSQSTPARP